MNDALLVTAVTCLLITIIGGVLTQRPPRSSGSDGSDDSAEAEGLGEEAAVITKSDEDQEADALGFREERQASRPTSRSLSAQAACRRRDASRALFQFIPRPISHPVRAAWAAGKPAGERLDKHQSDNRRFNTVSTTTSESRRPATSHHNPSFCFHWS